MITAAFCNNDEKTVFINLSFKWTFQMKGGSDYRKAVFTTEIIKLAVGLKKGDKLKVYKKSQVLLESWKKTFLRS